jgi:hypothetical protein
MMTIDTDLVYITKYYAFLALAEKMLGCGGCALSHKLIK